MDGQRHGAGALPAIKEFKRLCNLFGIISILDGTGVLVNCHFIIKFSIAFFHICLFLNSTFSPVWNVAKICFPGLYYLLACSMEQSPS
jgi:hypothetical protein